MSYNNKFNNKSASASNGKKPFCKVCHDAGKTESEYTSHYVRSMPDHNGKSNVTCPTLNATECRYCYKLGHTTKFCPAIAENEKKAKRERAAEDRPQRKQDMLPDIKATLPSVKATLPSVKQKKPINTFASLSVDSDNEEEKPIANANAKPTAKAVEEFPALFSQKKEPKSVSLPSVSWATMAEKPAVVAPVYNAPPSHNIKVLSKVVSKSWADYSDSEEEEEEEEKFQTLPMPTSTRNLPNYQQDLIDQWQAAEDDEW
jgi:hypothetical protein